MELLPSAPALPASQGTAHDGNVAPEPDHNNASTYDETFRTVLAGRQGSALSGLSRLSELAGGDTLPFATDAGGNELPAYLQATNVDGVVPPNPLLSSLQSNVGAVSNRDVNATTTIGKSPYLVAPHTSIPLATDKRGDAAATLARQSSSGPQGLVLSTTAVPAGLQLPLLDGRRSAGQEAVDVTTGVAPLRIDASTPSVFANNGISSLLTLTTAPSNNGGFVSEQIVHPFSQPGWGQTFSEKILWLVNSNVGQAELRLNPPDLGPLEIRIAVDRDQASVLFASQQALVRDVVEATIPRLREMMAASGFSDVDVSVGQQSLGSQDKSAGSSRPTHSPSSTPADELRPEQISSHSLPTELSLVDLYV